MQKLPKITIVTPSYNQGQFLEETILSVINQNYPDLEFLVFDGGSTDNSVEIIKKYEKHIDFWVSEPDGGQSDAINKGFHRASGEVLHWLNSDDVLLPGALITIGEYFRDNPEIDCAIGDLQIIDQDSRVLSLKKAIPFDFKTALYSACLVPQPSTPFTRRAWEATGDVRLDLRYQMDFEYYLRMAKAGINFGILRQPIAQFRVHGDSKTVSEYENLVWKANRTIQEAYLSESLTRSAYKETRLKILNWIYRLRSYALRGLIRGDLVPFKATIARKSV